MPWYLALPGSILVILAGIYKKLNIGLTMLLGSLTLGLMTGLPLTDFFEVAFNSLWNNITIMLVISILLLGILGYILKATKALDMLINSLQELVKDVRVISAAMPMLVGMLTVPGGAILSAPLCAATGNRLGLPPLRQAVVNNWFRHVIYFMFPLFPSIIITAELSGVSLGRLFMHNLPLTLIGIVFGYFYLFRGYGNVVSANNEGNDRPTCYKHLTLIQSLTPLLLILILVVFFDLYFPLALLVGIIAAIVNYLPRKKKSAAFFFRLKTMLLPGLKFNVAFVIIGIMFYKEMLEHTAAINELTEFLLTLGLPVIILITVVSFVVGMLTGDNSASMAILLPMFIPLIPPEGMIFSAYVAYLYAGSTAGHIISPAHPCFALTKEYYLVEIKNFIILTLPLLLVVLAAGFIITMLFGIY
jgi:uncharacterized protein